MSINNLTTPVLKRLLSLQEKKETLTAQIAELEKQIQAVLEGASTPQPVAKTAVKKTAKKTIKKTAGKTVRKARGKTGEAILAALKEAGAKGATVLELAKTTGIKPQNLHVWFHTTGKKRDDIKKIGTAQYRLV